MKRILTNYFPSVMLRAMRLSKKTWFVFLLAFGFACTLNGPAEKSASGGTGSEIVGAAAYDSSAAAKRLASGTDGLISAANMRPVVLGNVFCYQRFSFPDTDWAHAAALPRVRTDSAGGFVITDAPPGEVVVEANDGMGNGFVKTIDVDRDSARYSIGVLPVGKTGAITVQAQTRLPGRVRFYVGVQGTRLVVRGDRTGVDVRLDDIPCGIPHTVSVRVYEPVYFARDFNGVSVSAAVTTALGVFQIK